jgi:hypothetical protein
MNRIMARKNVGKRPPAVIGPSEVAPIPSTFFWPTGAACGLTLRPSGTSASFAVRRLLI